MVHASPSLLVSEFQQNNLTASWQGLTMCDGLDFNCLGDPLFRARLHRFAADFGFEESVD